MFGSATSMFDSAMGALSEAKAVAASKLEEAKAAGKEALMEAKEVRHLGEENALLKQTAVEFLSISGEAPPSSASAAELAALLRQRGLLMVKARESYRAQCEKAMEAGKAYKAHAKASASKAESAVAAARALHAKLQECKEELAALRGGGEPAAESEAPVAAEAEVAAPEEDEAEARVEMAGKAAADAEKASKKEATGDENQPRADAPVAPGLEVNVEGRRGTADAALDAFGDDDADAATSTLPPGVIGDLIGLVPTESSVAVAAPPPTGDLPSLLDAPNAPAEEAEAASELEADAEAGEAPPEAGSSAQLCGEQGQGGGE